MRLNSSRYWLGLLVVAVIIICSACCSRKPPTKAQGLPPPLPERLTAVTDLGEYGWLVADKRSDARAYYIKQGLEIDVIIGAADKPILHHAAAGKLYFTCWGRGDSLFIDFPVMRIYNLKTGELETQQLFFGLDEVVAFGDPTRTPGNELRWISVNPDGLEIGFGTLPGAGPEAYAGAGLTIPWTQVSCEQGSLVLSLEETALSPQLRVPPAPPLSLIRDIRLTRNDALKSVRLALRVRPYAVYRAECGTGERDRVLSLYLKCRFPVRLGGPREG